MKKLSSLIIIFFIVHHMNAQTNYTPTGTWKYINGTDTIEVFFKTDQIMVGTASQSIIIGFHKYVKNGQVIENNLNFCNSTYNNKQFSIVIFDFKENDARNDGNIQDITLNYKRYCILTKVNPTTINVRLTSMEGRHQTGGVGYTLPRNFQLIKQ